MNRKDQVLLLTIRQAFAKAEEAYNKLSDDAKEKIKNLHNEGYTLDYCIRWGETAAREADEEFCEQT